MSRHLDLYRRADFRDLLAAASADPLDDAVRLVLADWLEEHDDLDRATFIRIQLERAKLHEAEPRSLLLSFDEEALLNRNRRAWVSHLPDWLRRQVQFVRGLPGRAELKAADFLEHAGEDWSLIGLHELTLSEVSNLWSALFDCERMKRVTSLNLARAYLGSVGGQKLAAAPNLSQLRELNFFDSGIDADALAALAHSPHLTRLARLSLGREHFGAAGIKALASTDFLSHIETLEVYCSGVLEDDVVRALLDAPIDNLKKLQLDAYQEYLSHVSVEAIANCPRLRNLETLNLQYSLTSDEQIEILAASPYLTNLRDFCFDLAEETDEEGAGLRGMEALGRSPIIRNLLVFAPFFNGEMMDKVAFILAESPLFANLRHLMLTYSCVTPRGMEALAGAAHLAGVVNVDLDDNPLSDDGVSHLLEAPFAANLLRLNLCETGIGAAGARRLADSAKLSQLRFLNISSNNIGPDGFAALVQSSNLRELRVLRADRCWGGPTAAAALATTTLPRLQSAYLSNNQFGTAGVEKLAASSSLHDLHTLYLAENDIGPDGVKALLDSPLAESLHRLDLTSNGLGDEGALYVAQCAALENLLSLSLGGNGITDEGAQALVESPYLQEALSVWLGSNPASTMTLKPPFAR